MSDVCPSCDLSCGEFKVGRVVYNFHGYHANSLKISESRPLAGLGLSL